VADRVVVMCFRVRTSLVWSRILQLQIVEK